MTSATKSSAKAGQAAPLVVRAALPSDLEGLYRLAEATGSGMTNLQPNRPLLAARLEASVKAMTDEDARLSGAPIFFVVDRTGADVADAADPSNIVGTALIFPRIGVEWPFYSYRLTRQAQTYRALKKTVAHDLLILANDFDGGAEVGGLFVDSAARGAAAGRLTARSRYLFLAAHRAWFGRQVISEMRGYQDETGASPVWEALGREFYDMEFDDADRLNAVVGNQFIADLAPKHPIYASLLAKAAREAVGRPHDDGRRAMALLIEEGFRYEGYVDIFDGGPTLFANIDDLRAVRDSRTRSVAAIAPVTDAPDQLACAGTGLDFRCARGGLTVGEDGGAVVDPALARALKLESGDTVRHVAF